MTSAPWMKVAASQLGYHEGPNNKNKYGKHYHLDNEPWCCLFGSWCCEKAGYPIPALQPSIMPNGFAAVYVLINYAKKHGLWLPSWQAEHGFGICYGWKGPSSTPDEMHFGLIESSGPKGSLGHTIEGNRADQVERQTFTVGSNVVLGTVDLPRLLLGRPKITVKGNKTDKHPQPRHPAHPANTGPHPSARVTVVLDGKTYSGTLPQT